MIDTGFLGELMARHGVPGVAAGVIHGDAEEVAGVGVTSVENPLPVDGGTLFQIGSITKTLTATAVLRLADAVRLDLDEPVRTYLPGLRLADEAAASGVTLRHLLSHTGGWAGDYFASLTPGDDALEQMMARLDRLEQLTPLGQLWAYNNAGFYIAGRVIEVVTGQQFETALRALVLAPLGLRHWFFMQDELLTYRFAVGHDRSGEVARPWALGRPAGPVGGLITSAAGLLRYGRAQWDAGDFLSAAARAEMRRPHAGTGGAMGDAVGLGWFLEDRDGHRLLRHGGSTNGQGALLVVAPEDQFALAVLANSSNGGAVARDLEAEILRVTLGIEPRPERYLERSPEQLAGYAGPYAGPLWDITVTVAGDDLVLEQTDRGGFPEPDSPPGSLDPPRTRLGFTGPDAVIARDGPLAGGRGDFLRGPDGEISWLRWAGRLNRPA